MMAFPWLAGGGFFCLLLAKTPSQLAQQGEVMSVTGGLAMWPSRSTQLFCKKQGGRGKDRSLTTQVGQARVLQANSNWFFPGT